MPATKRSAIGYCDFSGGDLNFVLGCTPVSAGCANCYARRIYDRFGKDFSKVTTYSSKLHRLERWLLAKRPPSYKRGPDSRPLAFVCDMGDLFHKDVSEDFILRAFWAMQYRDDIDWLVLTKRAIRMRRLLRFWNSGNQGPYHPAENIWLGVTVENEDYLWRIDELLKTPAAIRWVSYEPALGPLDIGSYLCYNPPHEYKRDRDQGVRGGRAGRFGNRREGKSVAHSLPPDRSLDSGRESDPLHSASSRTSVPPRVSSGSANGEQDQSERVCSQTRMVSFFRPDRPAVDHQSQKWHQERQSARESGVSYLTATSPARCTHPEDGPMRQSKGREASQPKIHQRADNRDSFASGSGLSQAEGVSREISCQPVNNFGHSHQANLDTYSIGITWLVVGADSGPNRRPFKKEWAWAVLDQCREAGVACFLKQASGIRPGMPLRDREGREVKEWPKT